MRFGYNDALAAGSPMIGLLRGSGSDTIRLRLSWNRIQQARGPFDWSHYDGLYGQLLRQGVRPLWVIVEAPCWTAADPAGCDPAASAGAPGAEHAGDLGAFAAAVAQRYPESLGIEVGNEVNDARFWPGGQDPVAYAELLRTTAAAVDEVDPEMPVVASGLSPIEEATDHQVPWRDYLDATIAAGGFDGVDAVAFHPYAQLDPGDDPGGSTGALVDEVLAFLDERGQGGLPLWITETGLSTAGRKTLSDAAQAEGLVAIYEDLEARGIPVVHVHRLVDEANPDFPLEQGFGVVEEGGRGVKPAYCALAALRGVPCP